jgi:hypothetical protein
MELTNIRNTMNKIALIVLICLFANCTKDTYETFAPTEYDFFYPTEEATIDGSKMGDGT